MTKKIIELKELLKTRGPDSRCTVGAGQVSQDEDGTLVGKGEVFFA
jgi:hypothetical protein